MVVGLVGIILLDRLNPAGPALLMFREVFVVAAYAWLMRRGIEMRVDLAGKVSSALTMVATGGAILLDEAWVDALFWVAVALAIGDPPELLEGGRDRPRGAGVRPRPAHEGLHDGRYAAAQVGARGAPMDAQPDLSSLTDAELKDLIRQLDRGGARGLEGAARCCTAASSSRRAS